MTTNQSISSQKLLKLANVICEHSHTAILYINYLGFVTDLANIHNIIDHEERPQNSYFLYLPQLKISLSRRIKVVKNLFKKCQFLHTSNLYVYCCRPIFIISVAMKKIIKSIINFNFI